MDLDTARYFIELKLPGKITEPYNLDGSSSPVKELTLIALENNTAEVVDVYRIYGEINEADYQDEGEPIGNAIVIIEAGILEGYYPGEPGDYDAMKKAFTDSFRVNEYFLEAHWEDDQLDIQYFILAEV